MVLTNSSLEEENRRTGRYLRQSGRQAGKQASRDAPKFPLLRSDLPSKAKRQIWRGSRHIHTSNEKAKDNPGGGRLSVPGLSQLDRRGDASMDRMKKHPKRTLCEFPWRRERP